MLLSILKAFLWATGRHRTPLARRKSGNFTMSMEKHYIYPKN